MALAMLSVCPSFSAPAMVAPSTSRAVAPVMETAADLEALASKLNPIVGFWDPMNLAEYDQFSVGQEASIGFLRQAEIKHGRVAMAAFVGYIVQANGICFPWGLTGETSFADISAAGGPPDQWDALPTAAKLQIILFIGFLETSSESTYILEPSGMKHYMKGGKPGAFPSIKSIFPHPIPLDLYDPFGFSKSASPEKKEKGLLIEINNGRLAMLGIMGFLAESKVPGSVPALTGIVKPYAGEVMAPFAAGDAGLPFVKDMLSYTLF
jgi:hypothetical protein